MKTYSKEPGILIFAFAGMAVAAAIWYFTRTEKGRQNFNHALDKAEEAGHTVADGVNTLLRRR